MTGSSQGELANLWAVGGAQVSCEGGGYRYCPECGWQLTGKFSTCPRCRADLRMVSCPYCGGRVPAQAELCPRCTAPLDFSTH
ncbi:MAG: double zinc ribbon domain-containing protein [Brevefilum sp.]